MHRRSIARLLAVALVAGQLVLSGPPAGAELGRTIFSDNFESVSNVTGAPPANWEIFTVAHFNDNHLTRWNVRSNPSSSTDERHVSGGQTKSLSWNDQAYQGSDSPNPPDWSDDTRDDFPVGLVYRNTSSSGDRPGVIGTYTMSATTRMVDVGITRLEQNDVPISDGGDLISYGAVVGATLWPPMSSQPCPDDFGGPSQTCRPAGALGAGVILNDGASFEDEPTDTVEVAALYVAGFVNQDDVTESGFADFFLPIRVQTDIDRASFFSETHTISMHVFDNNYVGVALDGVFYGWSEVRNPDGSEVLIPLSDLRGMGIGGAVRNETRFDNFVYQEGVPDFPAPDTFIVSHPDPLTNQTDATFEFDSEPQASSFECRLDGGAWEECESPHTYTGLAEGDRTFSVRGRDPIGQTDPDPPSFAWTIDLTPPVTTIDDAPGSPTNETTAAFAFSADEASTFACSLDGAAPEPCESPVTHEGLADGPHTFEVTATDLAGNADPDPATHDWTVDTVAPEATITSAPPALSNSRDASFTFESSEPGDFACSLDGAAFAACSSPQEHSGLADGEHTFEVQATDDAGNVSDPASHTWTIDATSPLTTITAAPPASSDSPDASFSFTANEPATFECALDGGAFGACSSPDEHTGLADGEHTFEVRATDDAGNLEEPPASHTWTVDTVAPVVTITAAPPDPSDSRDASFSFAADEPATFTCSLDGAAFTSCTSPRSHSDLSQGTHTFQVRATDQAGNVSAPAEHTWVVDTPPATTITSAPTDPTNSPDATFAFTADEPSDFECSLDGAAFSTCFSPVTYPGLADGEHTFTVRAIDQDETPQPDPNPPTHTWRVDTVAPDTSIDSGPPAATNATDATFEFSASEPASFECALDGGAFEACSSPKTYTGLADGDHTFTVRATDTAGNTDPAPAERTWTVDTVPPETTIDVAPAAATSSTEATFEFSASKPSTFECSLDGGAFEACESPKTYTALADGDHTFAVRATDTLGNTDPTPAAHTWTVDTAPPATTLTQTPPALTNSADATFEFTASEPATFACSLDGAAFASCSSPVTEMGLADGDHTFRVLATDDVGNVEADPAEHAWTIDTLAPDTFIDAAPPAVDDSTTATFEFSASEPSTFECSLNAGAFEACAGPKTYTDLAEGDHSFAVRATDAAGNVDPDPAVHTWAVDTAPATSLTQTPPALTNSPDATFAFTADEPSDFECSLDGAAFEPCESPVTHTALADGVHTFSVRAIDQDHTAQADPNPPTHTWQIDTVPPVSTFTEVPEELTSEAEATFAFEASEPADFACSLDGAAFTACTSPVHLTGLAEGSHTFAVLATDLAGNVEAEAAEHTWSVETAPPPAPEVEITSDRRGEGFLGAGDTADGEAFEVRVDLALEPGQEAEVLMDVSDDQTTVSADALTLTGEDPSATVVFDVRDLEEGPVTVTVEAVRGGRSAVTTRTVILDLTPPVTEITTPGGSSFVSLPFGLFSNVRIEGGITDNIGVRTVAVVLRNENFGETYGPFIASRSGPPTDQSWVLSGVHLNPGTYSVRAYGIDEAMNVEDPGATTLIMVL